MLSLDCSFEAIKQRIQLRSQDNTRNDDDLKVLEKRMKTHNESTQPILEFYEKEGKLAKVNSEKSIEEVYQEVK